jgi:hypothetical protein
MQTQRVARMAIVAVAAAAALTLSAQAAPGGGHDAMLRDLIRDTAGGQIPYGAMTPGLAAAVKSQATIAQAELAGLGALKSVTFVTTDRDGAERYRTIFEHGALEWAFSVDAQGLIANAKFRPLSAGL